MVLHGRPGITVHAPTQAQATAPKLERWSPPGLNSRFLARRLPHPTVHPLHATMQHRYRSGDTPVPGLFSRAPQLGLYAAQPRSLPACDRCRRDLLSRPITLRAHAYSPRRCDQRTQEQRPRSGGPPTPTPVVGNEVLLAWAAHARHLPCPMGEGAHAMPWHRWSDTVPHVVGRERSVLTGPSIV